MLPDIMIWTYSTPHTYNSRFYLMNRYLSECNSGLFGMIKYGMLLHYVGDFFTRPHNAEILVGYVKGHKSWERKLHKYIRSIDFNNLNTKSRKSLVHSIAKLHDDYVHDECSIDTDIKFIVESLELLFKYKFSISPSN